MASFVAEARQKVDASFTFRGYWLEWGGRSRITLRHDRLKIVVPLSLALIFLLLYGAFNSGKDALLVLPAFRSR